MGRKKVSYLDKMPHILSNFPPIISAEVLFMWLGDWFLISENSENNYNAIHKYYIKDNTYSLDHTQQINIFNQENNLFGYILKDYNRFWNKVNIPKDYENNCWVWNGGITSDNYGQFKIVTDRSPMGSHRFSYQMFYGPIPGCFIPHLEYLEVMHSCNNRLCCNPNHLSVGDSKTNGEYMVQSGRSLTNELNPAIIYSNDQVIDVFENVKNNNLKSVKEIMNKYKMTFSEVHALFDGRIRGTLTSKYDLKKLKKKICFTRLTTDEVIQIKILLKENTMTAVKNAKMFNKSKECVYGIKYGRYYKDV
jgi:hypothetical protein